ncbi:hypothetical protein DASB73_011050 [Starmerella bacillaris]|uniref:Magnesium transporter n=1 Tax=Starmerella bacillaris TaxID=1247836 RepID=A0AAV5RG15_STABA|nr:hypothetical protein DASB73_011050 [Starmerella bacillaris]
MTVLEDKWIGLGLAIASSFAIGTSFIITKKGLQSSESVENYDYLKKPLWWAGMLTMAVGEIANFAAYTFAPAILVTPLGALSVIIGAILAAIFLNEELGVLGRLGCAICLVGAVIIVLHAPPDKDVQTVDEILVLATKPAFLGYCTLVLAFALFMIYKVAPRYGRKTPMIYVSICSSVGSISVMAIKAFGIALKLTLSGNNQFSHISTYVFITTVAICILTQMNYFNKALDQFDTSIVNPLYYVSFTTCTLTASFLLFQGFNTTNAIDIISLLLGFVTTFLGVYLLNLSRSDKVRTLLPTHAGEGIPMDNTTAGIQKRHSMSRSRSVSMANSRSSSQFSLDERNERMHETLLGSESPKIQF